MTNDMSKTLVEIFTDMVSAALRAEALTRSGWMVKTYFVSGMDGIVGLEARR